MTTEPNTTAEYPELPDFSETSKLWLAICAYRHAKPGIDSAQRAAAIDEVVAAMMRAYVDADRASRAQAAQAVPHAHEIWAAAQLVPGEGIEDGVKRIEGLLAAAPSAQAVPAVNAVFETSTHEVAGTTAASVKRVERQDDGSLTVVIDHWPSTPATPVAPQRVWNEVSLDQAGAPLRASDGRWLTFEERVASITTQPQEAAPAGLKDHEVASLVNRLRDIAVLFHDSQQLRERIAHEIRPVATGLAAPAITHTDDAAVDALAALMKAKLAKQRAKGYGGWDSDECTREYLSNLLREHADKGDPVDVANFCAFLSARGESIGVPTRESAETWLRSRYGAYRGHPAWRELEEAFNAGWRGALATPSAPVPVGSVTIQHFRGDPGMENRDYDYWGNLPPGTYTLYTEAKKGDSQ